MSLCKGTFYTICCSLEAEISQAVFTQRAGLLPSCLLTGLWVINSFREVQCCVFMTHWGSGVCSSFRTAWNCPGIFHHWNLLHHPQEPNFEFCLAANTSASLSSHSSLGHLLQHFSESLFLVDTPLLFLCMVLPELQTHCNLASSKLLEQYSHSLLNSFIYFCRMLIHCWIEQVHPVLKYSMNLLKILDYLNGFLFYCWVWWHWLR